MSEGNSCRTEYLLAQGALPKHNCSSLYASSGQFVNLSNVLSERLQSAPRSSEDLWKCSDSVFFWGLRRLHGTSHCKAVVLRILQIQLFLLGKDFSPKDEDLVPCKVCLALLDYLKKRDLIAEVLYLLHSEPLTLTVMGNTSPAYVKPRHFMNDFPIFPEACRTCKRCVPTLHTKG